MRDSRWVVRNVVEIALSFGLLLISSCRSEPACANDAELGTVGDPTSAVTAAEVDSLAARVRTAGGSLTKADALVDLLWQESERQRLGLPGGPAAKQSRRKVALGHQNRLRAGTTPRLRDDPKRLPPGAKLTDCGQRVMAAR